MSNKHVFQELLDEKKREHVHTCDGHKKLFVLAVKYLYGWAWLFGSSDRQRITVIINIIIIICCLCR